jgi:hypothetical protein
MIQVRGPADYLEQDLGEGLAIVGRIPPPIVWDYIQKILLNPLKEVILLKLGERPRSLRVLIGKLGCVSGFKVIVIYGKPLLTRFLIHKNQIMVYKRAHNIL